MSNNPDGGGLELKYHAGGMAEYLCVGKAMYREKKHPRVMVKIRKSLEMMRLSVG